MWLKHRKDVTSDNLPLIDSASSAISRVKSARHDLFRVMNLDRMLRDSEGFHGASSGPGPAGHTEQQWQHLLQRIERYEVVLLCDPFHPPLAPPFRRKMTHDAGEDAAWHIDPRDPREHPRLDLLLRGVTASGRIGASSRAAAVETVAATTAVKAAVTREKRYPLVVTLTYHPPLTVCAAKVAAPRFKWENEVSGPETRRSGEVKSGPTFSDLRRREMLEGEYRLEFQNATLDACAIKQPRR